MSVSKIEEWTEEEDRWLKGKSVVDGFIREIYVPGRAVDFDQNVVIQVLNNEHKVNRKDMIMDYSNCI